MRGGSPQQHLHPGARLRLCWAVVLVTGGVWLPTEPAAAYLSRSRFDQTVLEGGGGGRHFTGSPFDGQSCNVCHVGGKEPRMTIDGLPIDTGFDPQTTYSLTLSWPAGTNSAAAMEMVDAIGFGAGLLQVIPDGEQVAEDRCATGIAAASAATLDRARSVVGVDACGAQRLRALWTSPANAIAEVNLYAVLVQGDQSGTTEGDGVQALNIALPLRGEEATGPQLGGGCHVAHGKMRPHALAPGLLLLLWAWRRRRRAVSLKTGNRQT